MPGLTLLQAPAIALVSRVAVAGAAQNPIREVPLHIDAASPPENVPALVAESDAVVRIVVKSVNPTQVPAPLTPRLPR